MQNEKVSNWDLTAKLLNDNEMELQMTKDIHGAILHLIFNDIAEHNFYLPCIVDKNQTIEGYINKMPVSIFRDFYEALSETIIKIRDIYIWKEKLIMEYQKGD